MLTRPAGDGGQVARRARTAEEGWSSGRTSTMTHASWEAACPVDARTLAAAPRVAHVAAADASLRYLLLNQMRSQLNAGYAVTGISAPGPDVPAIEAVGIRHVALPFTRRFAPWADLVALWRLYRVLRRERFAVVHTHTPKGGLLGQYAGLLARVPVRVHTIHGLYFPGHMKPKRRWIYILLERVTMRFSHLNLSQSPEDIPTILDERICRRERVRLLGNGIDLATFDPAGQPPERRAATRAALGLAPEHRVVGVVARFVAEKGYREMLRAAQILRDTVPEVRFVFIGPVEAAKHDALDPRLIDEMGLANVVRFLGHRTDMPDLYAAMDVLALPSHREGFPRAPMEAAAMGVPAVVTDIRGCRQTVEQGVTGYLVPRRDPEGLAAALRDLITDDAKRLAFGRAAREKAVAEFDERVVFARVNEAYAELLSHRAVAARGA
jgi:glycosyltransferase involved in cell wall biosynthesis